MMLSSVHAYQRHMLCLPVQKDRTQEQPFIKGMLRWWRMHRPPAFHRRHCQGRGCTWWGSGPPSQRTCCLPGKGIKAPTLSGQLYSCMQIEELDEELAEQRTGTARHAMQELQGQLKQANQLLAERQAMWERTAAEHAARSLTLERQLAQVRFPHHKCIPSPVYSPLSSHGRCGVMSAILDEDDTGPVPILSHSLLSYPILSYSLCSVLNRGEFRYVMAHMKTHVRGH